MNVRFAGCDLTESDFYHARLTHVAFEDCMMDKSEFSGATLDKVDFRTSDVSNLRGVFSLRGAIIDSSQLIALGPLLAAQVGINVIDD